MNASISYNNMFFLLVLHLVLVVPLQAATTTGSKVEFLPGFEGPLPFHLETGYIGVGKSDEVQLFYYFIKSESDPENDPIILWLTGGPGCSSFSALAYEIGPLYFTQKEYNGSLPELASTPNSWTKGASMIFLEQPVHTGFSYATTAKAMMITDLEAVNHTYEFLLKWLSNHPEFTSKSLYVAGDSYAGIIVPRVMQKISDGIEAGNKPLINIKGYLLGNPITSKSTEDNYQIPFCHGMGLISDELYESLKKNCKGEYNVDSSNVLCSQDLERYHELVDSVNDQHILMPSCGKDTESPRPSELFSRVRSKSGSFGGRRSLDEKFSSQDFGSKCYGSLESRHKLSNHWANDPAVQATLHVRKGTVRRWARCYQDGIKRFYSFTSMDSFSYHVNLSTKGYRSLIFSGDHDMGVPFQSTEAWIRALNNSIVDDWRPWLVDGQIAGYTRSYSNKMTYATVKGAGHVAAEYKREECFLMFKRWISNDPL
ncbi:hypothetical protein RND71_012501 [Anisodus tanguticus]|uniref:Uncharacterized protein n=1 Tax=Anisodus tanguticus TaxID=243964 RepID=A0AAE1VPV4_9SOLA|nr:hypothetical protein RND71_012501 [Anisodus tanguticus]